MKAKKLILPSIFFLLAFPMNAVMDILSHKHSESIFSDHPPRSFWGSESWVMKYEGGQEGEFKEPPDTWYYETFDISYKEDFPLSATALVFLTDGWHFAQFLQWAFIITGLVLMARLKFKESILLYVILSVAKSVIFEYFYSNRLKKK